MTPTDRANFLSAPDGATCWSKSDDYWPEGSPRFIESGYGARVSDDRGREYLDWTMGLRSVILGHAYYRVVEAARRALSIGANHSRPTRLESELAERLVHYVPGAERVKLGKNGSDAVTAAVRLARAFTGRHRVLACAQPFHASDDWWLSTQPRHGGTVDQDTELFRYNDRGAWMAWRLGMRQYAAVVLEPMSFEWPAPGYLEWLRRACTNTGTVLVFDEVISGFRFALGGAQQYFQVTADLACFGKAMANGFSVSALTGRSDIMSQQNVHALSSTHGGETHALAAAIATIDEIAEHHVPEHLSMIGKELQVQLQGAGYEMIGHPASPAVRWSDDAERRTFTSHLVDHNILGPYFAPSFSHTLEDVARTVDASHLHLGLIDIREQKV